MENVCTIVESYKVWVITCNFHVLKSKPIIMENGRIVIVAYKPIAGKEKELEKVMKKHVSILRTLGLATLREPGTVLEVLEWKSRDMSAEFDHL
jgi:hypothetical protein